MKIVQQMRIKKNRAGRFYNIVVSILIVVYMISLLDKPNIEDLDDFYSQYGVIKFLTAMLYLGLGQKGTIGLLFLLTLFLLYYTFKKKD